MYYNRKFEPYREKLDYLNRGYSGIVYYNKESGQIFKKYYNYTSADAKLNINTFDLLKNIDNPHFIKLEEAYMCGENNLYQKLEEEFKLDAYTAKYYEKDNIDILFESVNLLLDNFNELENLLRLFSKLKLYLYDMQINNLIISNKTFIIIDADQCSVLNINEKDLIYLNRESLYYLYVSIVCKYYKDNGLLKPKKLEKYLFQRNINFDRNLTDNIAKDLKYVKKPIDFYNKLS